MRLNRRHLMLAALASLAACGERSDSAPAPLEIEAGSTCDLDGMLLADYPGPKAQIHFAGQAQPSWYCDTVEMLNTLLRPEQLKPVRAVFVQDMAKADWEQPRGHWFEARSGFYVLGSRRHGSMGPTAASFRSQADAQQFVAAHGGRVLAYAEIKPEMVDLSGGALHDSRM
ncbi:MAG TPA: nitrous oxide reductase accessory protein NosL [Roseateles sp.]|nr:nitrous oxide reductase accessory protein NosL [Roseateles sp.]